MKLQKSLLTLTLSALLTHSATVAANVSGILPTATKLLQSLGTFSNLVTIIVDDLVAGGPFNYYHDFPKENLANKKYNYEFNNLVVFGDSIGDQGASGRKYRYIAGGFEAPMYLDYLSLGLTGKNPVPYTVGGLNYSLRGASMSKIQDNRKSIQEQYEQYLEKNDGKADPRSVYVLWGGNMDLDVLVAQNIFKILTARYNVNAPEYTLNDSPQKTAKITQDLLNRGAPYVYVANIADGTIFPYSMLVAVEQIVDFTVAPLKLPYTWIITAAGRKIDRYARNPKNTIAAEGRYFYRNNHIDAMHSQLYWFLPKAVVALMYDGIAYIQDKTIAQYNNSLEKALATVDGNIVYFDFRNMINEVAYNYKDYGFDTVLVPTCTLGYSSRFCDVGSRDYHPQISLFSDWFHPSPQLHIIMGQTMQAIFNAPVYASSIARQADNINQSREFFIDQKLRHLLFSEVEKNINQPALLIGYSGSNDKSGIYVDNNKTHTDVLNIGMYTYLIPKLLVGGAVSLGYGKNKPHDNFMYDFNHQHLSLFTQYTFNDNTWFHFDLGIGQLNARNIVRSTTLYKNTVHHTGETKAYSYNVLAKLGTNIINDDNKKTGPIAEIGFNQFKVNGYKEEGKSFLAMKYNQYTYNKKHIGIGWYYQYQTEINSSPVKVFVEAKVNRRLGGNSFKVPASLATAPVMFKREIKDLDKQWLTTKVGAEVKVSKKAALSPNVGYTSDFKRHNNFNYTLGVNYQF